MKKKMFIMVCCISILQFASAQKIKWETGDLSVLKDQTTVATSVNYEGMQVSEMPEAQFVEERVTKFNAEKAGEGDKFREDWKEAKATKFMNRFNEHFTKASKEKITASSTNTESKYIILLTPTSMDLGKGKYFGTKPALVDFNIVIAENANRNNIIAKGTAKEVKGESKAPKGSRWIPGAAGDAIDVANRVQNFDLTNRIAESFELLAVTMGKALRK